MILPYLSFMAFLAQQYETFLVTFQSKKTLIDMLFRGMTSLQSYLKILSAKSLYILM